MSRVSVISVCNYVTLTMCVTQSVVTVVARARNVHRSSAIAAIGSLVTEYSRDIAPRNEIRLGILPVVRCFSVMFLTVMKVSDQIIVMAE